MSYPTYSYPDLSRDSDDQLKQPLSSLAGDDEFERTRRFWLGLLYAALAGYAAAAAAIVGYVALTWAQADRGWMLVTIAIALLLSSGMYGLRYRLVDSRYRVWLFGGWNTAMFGFIVLLCVLDSGINSPMTYLYILPMLYLGIGFPLRAVLASGFVGLLGCALLINVNTGPVYGPTNLLQLLTLSIGWLLAVIGALNRHRQDREMRGLRRRLEKLAATDELTGCLNQRAFSLAAHREVARATRYHHELALLLIDVDYFKQVNDQHGHLMGDQVLHEIGALLRQTARDADVPGRPGGDELALLAPETDAIDACALAERLQRRLTTPPLPIDVTLSIGVYATSPEGEDLTTLFRRADQALYEAKRRGRDQVAIYDGSYPSPN